MPTRRIEQVLGAQTLVHLTPAATVVEAAQAMAARQVGAILVMAHDELEGIFTERDIVERVVAAARDPAKTLLGEVMTLRPITIPPQSTILDALRLMHLHHLRHLPVARNGTIIGVVSMRDFVEPDVADFARDHPLTG